VGSRAALIAVAALGAAGCAGTGQPSSASSSSLPKSTLATCTLDGLIADCGNVWVSQDWAQLSLLSAARVIWRETVVLSCCFSLPGGFRLGAYPR